MEQKKLCLSINARNIDRISSLPDCILHQILSFLETKTAVQTSIFSKRWQNVFYTTPFLSFSYNFSEFADPLQMPDSPFNKLFDGHKDGFQNCISKVLQSQNGYACKKIIIRCDLQLDSGFMSEVMEYAVKHKAQELEIMAFSDDEDCVKFPISIYTCKTLEKLKLGGDQYDCIYVSKSMGRISSLPDCILHQILSFLETKNAVQTSTLSKRWQNVFDTTSYFNFSYDFSEFADPNYMPAAQFNEFFDGHKDGFQKCISKALHAHNGYDCKKIIIRCDLKLDSSFMSEVMEYAVKHKAQELEIMAFSDDQDSLKFPMSICTCKTLEKLKLGGDQYDCMYVSKFVGFQFLKELRLYRLFFDCYFGFNEDIFSYFPCLELLSLDACSLDSSLELWIPKLKTFELIFPLSEKLSSRPSYVKLSSPMLSHIKYEAPDPTSFILDDCASSLEEIDIDIQDGLSDKEDFRKKYFIERLIDMLRRFHNAKSVIISLNTLEILSSMPSLLRGQESPFANLKNIQLKTSWSKLAPGWSFLLKNSPNVKALIQGDLNKVTSQLGKGVRQQAGNERRKP